MNPHPSESISSVGLKSKIPEFKIIMVGSSGVGKTCIALRAGKGIFQEQNPTIGFAFQKLHREVDGQPMNLFVWDTAG